IGVLVGQVALQGGRLRRGWIGTDHAWRGRRVWGEGRSKVRAVQGYGLVAQAASSADVNRASVGQVVLRSPGHRKRCGQTERTIARSVGRGIDVVGGRP